MSNIFALRQAQIVLNFQSAQDVVESRKTSTDAKVLRCRPEKWEEAYSLCKLNITVAIVLTLQETQMFSAFSSSHAYLIKRKFM